MVDGIHSMIAVYGREGDFIGYTQVKPEDTCKVCGEKLSVHMWIAADNGEHIVCDRLADGKFL